MRAEQPHASPFPLPKPQVDMHGSQVAFELVSVWLLAAFGQPRSLMCGSFPVGPLRYAVRQRGRCLGEGEPDVMIKTSAGRLIGERTAL